MIHSLSTTSRNQAADRIDAAIELLLAALLVTMPFALGVVAPWSEAIVVMAVAATALLLAIRAWLAPDRQQSLGWALTPILVFIAVAAVQLMPLPSSIVGVASPNTASIKARLLGDLPGAAGLLERVTLSFYPAATCHDLRLVLVYSVVFLAAAQVIRREAQFVRVLWAIALSGGCAAILALLQDLSGSGKIYWTFDTGHDVATGGPFVSYSNYSQYINLCTGAALGLLLYTLRRDDIIRTDGSRGSRKPHAGWEFRELRNWRAWLLLAIGALGFVTLCLSMSRGGMLALLCGIGLTMLMLARRRGMRGAAWVLALAALVAFVGLLYFGFDAVCDRMATLKNSRDPSAGRIQTFKDILVEWRKFPITGTGLGTHQYVYPMFDRSSDPELSEFADSDYFQLLEEMGVVGVALVLSFASYIGVCYVKAVRCGRPRVNTIAYGLGFGLLAVMVQSFTDFGQHLPSIGCISAVFCALLVNLSRTPRRGEAAALAGDATGRRGLTPSPGIPGEGGGGGLQPATYSPDGPLPNPPPEYRGREQRALLTRIAQMARLAIPVGFAVAMIWAVAGARAAWNSRVAADRAQAIADRLEGADWNGTDADYDKLFAEAGAAVEADSSDVNPRYELACYRWHAAARGDDQAAPDDADSATTRPAKGPSVAEAAKTIDELNGCRRVCPTFGPAYAVAGQIERLVFNQPIGTAHVRTAFELAPAHPEVCLAASQLDALEGKFDQSLNKAKRCLELDPTFLSQVIDFYVHDAARPDLAVAAAGDNPAMLFQVYHELCLEQEEHDRPAIQAAILETRQVLKTTCDRPDTPAGTLAGLGGLMRDARDFQQSISCYERALKKDYSQIEWRIQLAHVLADAGQAAEAIHQAEICLHLQPAMPEARQLIQDLNARPTVSDERGSASLDPGSDD